MDHRKTPFFGTPLSKCLGNDSDPSEGPINSRRAKWNQQQTVRDDQGRRRFHGAFTGGFSAGYYNTVDSVEGFAPRSFISHRRDKHHGSGGSASKFEHKPEDYMDDEDLGEFGIAPKKVRVAGQYSMRDDPVFGSNSEGNSRLLNLLKPIEESIGEKILNRISKERGTVRNSHGEILQKSDYHGLGYKPLMVPTEARYSESGRNPLLAVIGEGKRLKISGEAFGLGVFDDEDEEIQTTDAYGIDDITDYEFSKTRAPTSNKEKTLCPDDNRSNDESILDGFELSKNLNSIKLCDMFEVNNSDLIIDSDWKMPVRSDPYIPPLSKEDLEQRLQLQKVHSSDIFNTKFTSGSSRSIESDVIEQHSGLVSYSDIKAADLSAARKLDLSRESTQQTSEASITRHTVEWRPCSLLCKHFNVPNPYPGSQFFGVKPSDLFHDAPKSAAETAEPSQSKHYINKFAPMDLRRSIFNVIFDSTEVQIESDEEKQIDSDEEPQVLQHLEQPCDNWSRHENFVSTGSNSDEDQDSDIVLIDVPKQDPEVIVLSSSSSSSPDSKNKGFTKRNKETTGDDNDDLTDAYGPPLPPTRRTLIEVSRHRQSTSSSHQRSKSLPSSSSSSRHKKKHKKHNKRRHK